MEDMHRDAWHWYDKEKHGKSNLTCWKKYKKILRLIVDATNGGCVCICVPVMCMLMKPTDK